MISAIVNQKGGVGKTALTTNLAHVLATVENSSVLVVDADPQANATSIFGLELSPTSFTLNDVLADVANGGTGAAQEAIVPATQEWRGNNTLDILPAERALASRETDITIGREARLRRSLAPVRKSYDHILIDCPPSLGMLTTNALVAADQALIVTAPRSEAADGVAGIWDTISAVRDAYNPTLVVAGIAINAHRPDRTDRKAWVDALHEIYGSFVLDHAIPDREIVSAARTNHAPIPASSATSDLYQALTSVARVLKGKNE